MNLAPRVGGVLLLAAALGSVAFALARRDVSPEVRTLLAAQLRLPPEAIHIGRASLHPLGELHLYDLRLTLPRATASAAEAALTLDPLSALGGRIAPRRLLAERLSAEPLPGTTVRAERAAVHISPRDGRARLLLHDLVAAVAQLPRRYAVHAAHVSLDLVRGRPERLAASGVHVGAVGPADLLVRAAPEGLGLRGAMDGAELTLGASAAGAAAQLRMDRLRLPLQLGPFVDLKDARMSGRLDLRTAGHWGAPLYGAGTLTAAGQVALSDLALRHPVLTSGPLPNLGLLLDGELEARADGEGLALRTPRLSLSLGELRLSLLGEARRRRDGGHSVDLTLVLDEIDCAQLLQALPRRLVPHLEGLGVRGQLGGQIAVSFDSRTLPEVDVRPDVQLGCQVVSDPPRADPHALLDMQLTAVRSSEDGRPYRLPLGPRAEGQAGGAPFQPLRDLPAPVVRAFLVAEDNQFYQHHGFDVQMMIRALGLDLMADGTLRGASTVTQQLAKNLWLGSERALGRKLEEAVLAWRLEQVVDKERILEVYLNLVELGSGIYGISMASQHYFGVPASRLTLDQGAQLAALLPAPRRGMDAAWARRYRDILHRYGTALVPGPVN